MHYYEDALQIAKDNGCPDVTTLLYRMKWLYGYNQITEMTMKTLGMSKSGSYYVLEKVGIARPPVGKGCVDPSTRFWGNPCTRDPNHIKNGKSERYYSYNQCVECVKERTTMRRKLSHV